MFSTPQPINLAHPDKRKTRQLWHVGRKWRHVFPVLGRNEGLREKVWRKPFIRYNRSVFNSRLKMNDSSNVLSRIFRIVKILKILEKCL